MTLRLLTEDALLNCGHDGRVQVAASQSWVTIARRRTLVARDPETRTISICPNSNIALGMKPCVTTLPVQKGYSQWLRIEGRALCLASVRGLTDGTPQGGVEYRVVDPGQDWVRSAE